METTRSKSFDLYSNRSTLARLFVSWQTDHEDKRTDIRYTCSLELIDPDKGKVITVSELPALRKLRDELDKFIYVAEAMEIDHSCSFGNAIALYVDGTSIEQALNSGLLVGTEEDES